jgi:epoxyqueuosine reductase QueG
MEISSEDRQKLEADPARFLTRAIKEYALNRPANRLADYNNEPVIAAPLIGFADGRDPIFLEFKNKEIIGDFHLTPEEAFATYLERQQKKTPDKRPEAISVISVAFIASRETRLSNSPNARMASQRWGRAYGTAFFMMNETLNHTVSLLEAAGHLAVAPVCTRPMSIKISPEGLPCADWSEKHVAYAAGIGTFGLHTSLITPAGVPLHLGSVITDLAIKPTPRSYDQPRTYCRHFRDDSCHTCAQHCPSGAVNTKGFDGKKCMAYSRDELPRLDRELNGEPQPGTHPMCALCQIRVPCEARIPKT